MTACARGAARMLACAALLSTLALGGCASTPKTSRFEPSNHRDWSADQAVLARARFQGERVEIQNVRNCEYLAEDVFLVRYYDKTYDLRELDSVDFIVVPFKEAPSLAHTMLSFGFADRDYLAISVEARLEKGEKYSPLSGALRQYELMYVIADERDVIRLRTQHRNVDVYRYRALAHPQQARRLFEDMLRRANQLETQPEFYDTLVNNCTTNIVDHVNQIQPGKVPWGREVLLSGHSDRLAYNLGLLDTSRPFAELKTEAKINDQVARHFYAEDFSQRIRR